MRPSSPNSRRTVVCIGAATAFSLLGDQMLYSVLPVYYESLGLTAVGVGVLLSANRWIRLLTNDLAYRIDGGRVWLMAAFVPLSHRWTRGCALPAGRASWSVMNVMPSSRASARIRSSAAGSSVPSGKS